MSVQVKTVTAGPFQTNAYVVWKNHDAVIIDCPPDSHHPIQQFVSQQNLQIRGILLTHSHWDHIADAYAIKETFQAPLYIHPLDEENLKSPGSDGLPCPPCLSAGIDGYVKEGETLQLGSLNFEVVETPGHTPGGVCYFLPQEKMLFSGDTLFKGTIGNLSFPTARPKLMWKSLEKLSHFPENTAVFPGHGDSTSLGAENWLKDAEKNFNF